GKDYSSAEKGRGRAGAPRSRPRGERRRQERRTATGEPTDATVGSQPFGEGCGTGRRRVRRNRRRRQRRGSPGGGTGRLGAVDDDRTARSGEPTGAPARTVRRDDAAGRYELVEGDRVVGVADFHPAT